MDKEAFRKLIREQLEAGDKAFKGQYAEELNELMGLSREEIDKITPGTTDLQTYEKLITIVKQASAHNVSQAELVDNIKALGKVAVAIAKKSAKLASLLV